MALPGSPPKARVLPPVKPPRIIVEHFDIGTYKVDQANGYVEANCQHCGATIRGQRNVTSNFIQHMRRRHPDAYDRFAASSTHRVKRPRLTPSKNPLQSAPSPVPAVVTPPPQQQHVFEQQRPTPRPRTQTVERTEPQRAELTLETALVSATYRAAKRTSCNFATGLSQRTGCRIDIKREDEQVSGSAIFRAAYNHLAATPTSRSGLVAAASAALPVAMAAKMHSKPCLVVLPVSTPQALLRKITACEAKYELGGYTGEECVAVAIAKAAETNRTYVDLTQKQLVPGCSDAAAGYATLALELLQQRQHVDRIFMSGGNAPLFAGVSAVLQRVGRGVKLIGVVLENFWDEAGLKEDEKTKGDGELQNNWEDFAEAVVKVSESEVSAAVKSVFDDCDGCLLEPSGVLSVAGAVKYAKMNKLAHERIVCVVDSPLRQFGLLRMITANSWRGDGSQCVLCVQRRDEDSTNGGGDPLSLLMSELSGAAAGRLRVTFVKSRGKWPLFLGLGCDSTTTAAAHVANLTSLGYVANDVTASDLAEDEMWMWEDESDTEQERDERHNRLDDNTVWAVFRIEVLENVNAVVNFLAKQRTDPPLAKVSFTQDGDGAGRLLVAARGSEAQLRSLEREMSTRAKRVKRIVKSSGSVRGFTCSALEVPTTNGSITVDAEVGMERAVNGSAASFEAHTEAVHVGGQHNEPQQRVVSQHDVAQESAVQNESDPNHVHHHGHVEHVGAAVEHDDPMQEGVTQQGGHAEAVPPQSTVDQETMHEQHDAVHHEIVHEPVPHQTEQDVMHSDAVQHETAQHDVGQHDESQHNAVQHDDTDHARHSRHGTHHEEQPTQDAQPTTAQDCEAPLETSRPDNVQSERVIEVNEADNAVNEANNAANELAMSFAEGEAEVGVSGSGGEMDVRDGVEAHRQQANDGTGHTVEEAQLQDGVHIEADGAVGQDQQPDVEMQVDEPVDGVAVDMGTNPSSHVGTQDDIGQQADDDGARTGEDGVQAGAVDEGEDSVVAVTDTVMSNASAAAAAAEAVATGQMTVEDRGR